MISWFEKNRWLSWFVVVVIAGVIFYMSSLTFGGGSGSGTNTLAILYHIIIFFFFALFLFIATANGKKDWKVILLTILVAVSYGATDEAHQLFVPGRGSSVGDVLLDSLGVMYAFLVYFISIEWRKSKQS